MTLRHFVRDRCRAVIEEALRVAAESGIRGGATLAWIPNECVLFNRYDRRTRRVWHDELCRRIGADRRLAAVAPGET